MGDDNECRTVEVPANILKNECFGRRIKTNSCFVEDQSPRLVQKGSCNSTPLTLATGKLAASRPDPMAEAIGQRCDKR